MDDKVIFWGAFGQKAKRIFDNFDGVFDCIELFIDNDIQKNNLGGVRVERPNDYISRANCAIVVGTQRYFEDVYNELIFKYDVKKERILSLHEWVSKLISERKIKLKPRSVRLETCTLCQLDCAWCYMRTGNYGATGRGYLTFEKFKSFLDENNFIEHVEISNSGEVFLNKDLALILEYAYEKHIDITIGNGSNFNDVSDEMLELLVKTQVKFINISLDGASQEIYSIYRRKGDFNKVISNIRKLNEFKKKYDSVYPKLQWQYILMEHNLCDVKAAKQMAEELDMQIRYTYDTVKDTFEVSNKEELKEITGLKYLTKKEYNEAGKDLLYGQDYCFQMIFSPQINFDGRLLGCCIVWNDDWGINVFEDGLINGLNSEKYLDAILTLLGAEKNLSKIPNNPCLNACVRDMGIGERIRQKNYMYL